MPVVLTSCSPLALGLELLLLPSAVCRKPRPLTLQEGVKRLLISHGAVSINTSVLPSLAFNIDTENPKVFTGTEGSAFGRDVLQFGNNEESWIITTEPNGNGSLLKCHPYWNSCENIEPAGSLGNVSFHTLAASTSHLVACTPSVPSPCFSNIHLTGLCQVFDRELHPLRHIIAGKEECPIMNLDVVFLFDGSNSLSKRDLQNNKRFMLDIIRSSDTSIMHFAIVQYSSKTRQELTFKQFTDKTTNVEQIVNGIELMESITLTATAINFVIDNVFTAEGARDGASKLLIVITDGKRSNGDSPLEEIIAKARKKKIIRCAIGVGADFAEGSLAEGELKSIASTPEYLIKVKSYDDLNNIFESMKSKIYNIEGTQEASNESSFEMEMSQSGFSAQVAEGTITIGAVGAFDWSGGLFEITDNAIHFINVSKSQSDMKNSYLGYSMERAVQGSRTFYVVGAPRYQHKGKVVVFGPGANESQWLEWQHIHGEQIGSYFGSALCTVDLTRDGDTDLLLIGAPLYHEPQIGGTVIVCLLSPQGNFSCPSALWGQEGQTLGRFGSAISALGDLNGDGLTDVAVGAPLEDGHRGSVYIYHGAEGGIAPSYSQRISAADLSLALTFFGQSLDGSMDVTGDGLTDVAVGALGKVVLLRSRHVVDLTAEMTHTPDRIPLWQFVCPMENFPQKASVSNITVCFNISLATSRREGAGTLFAQLRYTIHLEGQRPVPRVMFDTEERELSLLWEVTDGRHCYAHELLLPTCVNDYLNPIDVHINFSLTALFNGSLTGLRPILNERGTRMLSHTIPIEINCGEDNVCTDHLNVTFHTEKAVLVGAASLLDLHVSVSNLGEDSYRPSIIFHQPLGLHFRKLRNLQSTHVECASNSSSIDKLTGKFTCNVSHPILQSNALAMFVLTFEVGDMNVSEEGLRIRAEGKSENPSGIYEDSVHEATIPVKYAVNIVVSRVSSTRYITFTDGMNEERKIKHIYKVENTGGRTVPVNVMINASEDVAGLLRWMPEITVIVQQDHASCLLVNKGRELSKDQPATERKEDRPELSKRKISFTMLVLEKNCFVEITLAGVVRTTGKILPIDTKLMIESEVRVQLDSQRFVNIISGTSHTAQIVTGTEFLKWYDPMPVILGSTFGGLLLLAVLGFALYKCGFFKRNFKERLSDGDAACDPPTAEPDDGTSAENC